MIYMPRQKEHSFFKIELQASKYWTGQECQHVGGSFLPKWGVLTNVFCAVVSVTFPFFFFPFPLLDTLVFGCPFAFRQLLVIFTQHFPLLEGVSPKKSGEGGGNSRPGAEIQKILGSAFRWPFVSISAVKVQLQLWLVHLRAMMSEYINEQRFV